MQYISSLKNLHQYDRMTVGGKAANLGELISAGLPVPTGFVVLTSAYEQFVIENGLQIEIERLAHTVSLTEPATAEHAALTIRGLFEQAVLAQEIKQAVLTAYQELVAGTVAVRSSATAEDLPGASFAGQQDTFLNIMGIDNLFGALRRCWSSLWTARALIYRAHQHIAPQSVQMALIVQQMVEATSAGVLFTCNPVTGAQNEMVINACWGLGEAIVSGHVTPDMITIDKESSQVKCYQVAEKFLMTVSSDNGVIEQAIPSDLRNQAVLSAKQIAELYSLGKIIEQHFHAPQDIEWAIAGEKVFLLQARPITAISSPEVMNVGEVPIPPGDDSWDSDDILPPQPFDLWTRTNVGENLPFPITPLTATGFPALFGLDKAPQDEPPTQGARRFYGRLYLNEGLILHNLIETYGIPPSFIAMIWGSNRKGKMQITGKWHPWRLLRNLPKLLQQGFSATKPKGPKLTPQEFFAQIDAWIDEFLQKDLSRLDDRALWAEGLPAWSDRGAFVFATNIRVSTPAGLMLSLLTKIVSWWTKLSKLAPDLITGLPGIYSAEVGPALWQMGQTLQALDLSDLLLNHSPQEALALLRALPKAQPFNEQLESFLQRHGHRCPNEVEFLKPRWVEAPEQVIELVANYLQSDEMINPSETEERQRQKREQAVAQIEAKLDLLRRGIFRALLKKAQQALPIRDNSRYFVTKFLLPIRMLFAQLGQRWTERGWLKSPDDIFFLTVKEIQAIVDAGMPSAVNSTLSELTANRRLAYEYWFTVVPPDVIGPDGKPVLEKEENVHMLEGIAVSGGKICGKARIVLDPSEAATLRTGEILVTQATDPGWTPVFPLVSGLVLEIGGQISHGAIVAREYGIPAVVNVRGATRLIRDGQTIEVDGTNGRVYLIAGQQ